MFLDYEIGHDTQMRFYHETRYTFLKFLKNILIFSRNPIYSVEMNEMTFQMNNYGIRSYLESSADQYLINW